MSPIPRVSLADLRRPVAHAKWEESVEALSVSLSKNNVVILVLPLGDAAHLDTVLESFQSVFDGSERSKWQFLAHTPGPEAPLAEPSGLMSVPGQERFDVRIGAGSTSCLPVPTRSASYEVSSIDSCF